MEINFEQVSLQVIAHSGDAKGKIMEALQNAKALKYEQATKLLQDAEKDLILAEKAHMEVVVKETQGDKLQIPLLLIHAEDQMLTTQTLLLVVQELIELYKKINH
ncbi:MAG: PTS lactose/cellobiose transporter subunit IIA [Mycoplasmataceae bacterium]|jgi:PTS system cellobiose-specific IIA component|nr:PTS lactose/cellobiose transporter subunit IIA [Mycoplasmataceae bacterium]